MLWNHYLPHQNLTVDAIFSRMTPSQKVSLRHILISHSTHILTSYAVILLSLVLLAVCYHCLRACYFMSIYFDHIFTFLLLQNGVWLVIGFFEGLEIVITSNYSVIALLGSLERGWGQSLRLFPSYLEFRTMHRAHKPSDSKCCSP